MLAFAYPSLTKSIFKLAQEKEEVRQCLLNLEKEVDELKNNLRALKNTADLVQASNSSYRAIAVRGTLSGENNLLVKTMNSVFFFFL